MSRVVLAIDPGPVESAWVVLHDGMPVRWAKVPNETLLAELTWEPGHASLDADVLVIEQVQHYGTGMPVGESIFETVYWSGRFAQAALPLRTERIGRKTIVTHLCGSARAKDSNARQALIDRFGGDQAIGRKATPGPLYGITGDLWQALAVAVAWHEGARNPKKKDGRA